MRRSPQPLGDHLFAQQKRRVSRGTKNSEAFIRSINLAKDWILADNNLTATGLHCIGNFCAVSAVETQASWKDQGEARAEWRTIAVREIVSWLIEWPENVRPGLKLEHWFESRFLVAQRCLAWCWKFKTHQPNPSNPNRGMSIRRFSDELEREIEGVWNSDILGNCLWASHLSNCSENRMDA